MPLWNQGTESTATLAQRRGTWQSPRALHIVHTASLGPDKVQKGHWKPGALCLWERKKAKHMPRAETRREKKENCFLRLLMQEKLREGWGFFVQILALVRALRIKMCGIFNPTLQERLSCFVIKQNIIKAMSHIIL